MASSRKRQGGVALARRAPPRERESEMRVMLSRAMPAIERRLAGAFTGEEMVALVMTQLRRNAALLECSGASILGSVFEASQLRLRFDSVLGHAYLVPFKREATLIVGYRGMITLATRAASVSAVWARTVYERDRFDVEEGDKPRLSHRPTMGRDRGNPVAAYGCFRMKDGFIRTRIIPWWEILEIRDKILSRRRSSDTPWKSDIEPMAWKTAIRRELKYVPLAAADLRAVVRDEYIDAGVTANMATVATEAVEAGEIDAEIVESVPAIDEPEAPSDAPETDPTDSASGGDPPGLPKDF